MSSRGLGMWGKELGMKQRLSLQLHGVLLTSDPYSLGGLQEYDVSRLTAWLLGRKAPYRGSFGVCIPLLPRCGRPPPGAALWQTKENVGRKRCYGCVAPLPRGAVETKRTQQRRKREAERRSASHKATGTASGSGSRA